MTVGRLNLRHLGCKQGVQQVLQLIKHLWANTTNGRLYRNLINAYQVHAGALQHILQETTPLPWSLSGWLTTIRNFLHSTSTKIILKQLWTPSPHRHNDRNIMDDALQHLPKANLKAINNVCIHLQVCYLSKITDANGLVLLPGIMTRHMAATNSKLLWPYQPTLPPDAWKQWSWAIHMLYT